MQPGQFARRFLPILAAWLLARMLTAQASELLEMRSQRSGIAEYPATGERRQRFDPQIDPDGLSQSDSWLSVFLL